MKEKNKPQSGEKLSELQTQEPVTSLRGEISVKIIAKGSGFHNTLSKVKLSPAMSLVRNSSY